MAYLLEPLMITDEERAELRGWSRRPTTAQALAMRARRGRWMDQHRDRRGTRGQQADGRQVAAGVRRDGVGRPGRCAEIRRTTQGR